MKERELYFKEHNDQIKSLSGRDYAMGTVNRYKTAYEYMASFIKWKYGSDDLELRELNYEFVSQFAYWLKSVRMCGHNSAMKYLKNFKKVVLECIKKDWLSQYPFVDFKTTLKEVIRVALTKEELGRIETKLFENDRLNHVKDIFLFSCYTGLAYIDVAKLRQSDVITGVDGGWWIISKRHKTDTATRIPLLPPAIEVLKKYKDNPKCIATT
ncbi:site-specific integrase [Mucilaginibacter sp. Bleaf8]|uniref:site-specific integrase n=1 Tax=Mucilaginibacter sp. Bleaf8 TaxID=2834430 RepID=UPI001BCADD6D|nr:site-specific integrase [Mucilaginibacter sp. Bleaf8]MBS7564522.1 site-specific integrase [Mucilaginibacter sp. Bleaf8]